MAFLGNVRALGREPLPRPRRSSWCVCGVSQCSTAMHNRIVAFLFYFSFIEKHSTLGMSTQNRVTGRGHRPLTRHLFGHPDLEDLSDERLAWMPIRVAPKRQAARVAYLPTVSRTMGLFTMCPHVVHHALIAGSGAGSGSLQTAAHRMCGVLYRVLTLQHGNLQGPSTKSHFPLLHATSTHKRENATNSSSDPPDDGWATRSPQNEDHPTLISTLQARQCQSTTLTSSSRSKPRIPTPRLIGCSTWRESVRLQGTTKPSWQLRSPVWAVVLSVSL